MNQASGLKQMLAALTGRPAREVIAGHQADGLLTAVPIPRRLCRPIAVAGGKGGVGKSTVAVNLGVALASAGHEVMLLDADTGLANVDVMLGLAPSRHLGHMLDGACTLQELLLPAACGLQVVPAGSGARRLAQLDHGELAAIIHAFDELARPPEYLLVDTAAGLADNVTMFAAAAAEVILVVCDEPASLTDAYGLAKVLSRDFGVRRLRMVANMTRNEGDARLLHQKLARVSDRFLEVVIEFSGWVPHDERLRQAIRRQAAVVELWPGSPSARAFKKLADTVDTWGEPGRAGLDRISFFGGRTSAGAEGPG
ncbi:P-loop NTPase [Rhodanobacter sp. PCA2]|uniref:MinD/ParA family ATP-binding protein n=1 Tax=Rhodanobacter sp. PCA2 TaxID=2006117 RepID=UPI0015E71389|nr:P-loop NTPase [Rhodanobacter sp. PCA2]MBA2077210.1 cobyrinic acid a,c-diamide synthase [Rhodanobacter sp. PCA2]